MSTLEKQGFKQTEIGVIPEDWNYSKLSEVCVTSSGTTPPRSQFDRYFRNGHINWVKTLDLNNSEIFKTDEQVTKEALAETSLKLYPVKTVLVAMYGGFNQIGRTGILRVPACVNQAITAIQCDNKLSPEYLLATLNFKVEHWKTVASSSRKDPNITSQDVRDFQIAYPSRNEQERIAESLSCIDSLIRMLDQLIAKRRDIQQATMQQLLTGQSRLPGFGGEWEMKRLGDVGELISGGTPKTSNPEYWGGDIKWCTPTDITRSKGKYLSETERSISEAGLADSGARLLPAGSLLICTRATIGELKIARIPLCTNQGFKSLICQDGISHEFMYYKLLTMKKDMIERAFGSTFLEISKANISAITLPIPPQAEQNAIAAILSDMDAELTALEARRDKALQLKQGMMQELLTGRTRLI